MTPWHKTEVGDVTASPEKGHMLRSKTRGFTLIEMMVTVAIFMIATAIGFITLAPALRDAKVSAAYNTTLMMMRQARQLAVDNRKTYLLTFNPAGTPVGTNQIQIQRLDAGIVSAPLTTVALPSDIQFLNAPGIPNTNNRTPDNFGTGSKAIEFDLGVNGGTLNQIYFFPDGSARDINNNTNNGIVYLARATELYSSRAITLFGAAGRVRGWRLYPGAAAGPAHWSQQ
jgi:prepilin-type N-terminal cleavage/methylation domain-containing protein